RCGPERSRSTPPVSRRASSPCSRTALLGPPAPQRASGSIGRLPDLRHGGPPRLPAEQVDEPLAHGRQFPLQLVRLVEHPTGLRIACPALVEVVLLAVGGPDLIDRRLPRLP